MAYKVLFIHAITISPWFGTYGVVVCSYILSRFLISLYAR